MSKIETIHIIGSGTLGRFIVEIIESLNQFAVGGFFSDDYPDIKSVLGYPVLGTINEIDNLKTPNIAIGIGEPIHRKKIYEKYSKEGFSFPQLVHNSVILSKYAIVEPGVIIGPNSSILTGSRIGTASCILSHVNINQDIVVEPYCLIAAGVIIGNNSILGEGCHIGLGCNIKLKQKVEPWSNYPSVG